MCNKRSKCCDQKDPIVHSVSQDRYISNRRHNHIGCGLSPSGCTAGDSVYNIPSMLRAVLCSSTGTDLLRQCNDRLELDTGFSAEVFADLLLGDWHCSEILLRSELVRLRTTRAENQTDFGLLELRIMFLSSATGVCYRSPGAKYSLRQLAVMWMTAHVPLYVWMQSVASIPGQPGSVPLSRLPCPELCVSVAVLPPIAHIVVGLNYFNETTHSSKSVPSSCVEHILSKTLPRRCQVRELTRFLLDYIEIHPGLMMFVERMVLISLLGLYPTHPSRVESTVRLDFKTVCSIVCGLYYMSTGSCIRSTMHSDVMTKSSTQSFFFLVIREMLLFQVTTIPALHVALNVGCKWQQFSDSVNIVIDTFRDCIYTVAASYPRSSNWLDISQLIRSSRKYTVSRFGTESVVAVDLLSTLLHIDRTIRSSPGPAEEESGPVPIGLLRLSDTRTNALIASCHGALNMVQLTKHLTCLKAHGASVYGTTVRTLRAMQADLSVAVYPLPEVRWVAQTLAANSAWSDVGGLILNPHASTFICCTACGAVHCNFCDVDKVATPGSVSVTVDDENQRLLCSDCVASRLRKLAYPTKLGQSHPAQLSLVHLIGNVLVHRRCMYTVCTDCGCVTKLDSAGIYNMTCSKCTERESKKLLSGWPAASGKKISTQCGVCNCSMSVDSSDYAHRQMCFYDDFTADPLFWSTLCAACEASYSRRRRTSKGKANPPPLTLEEFRRHRERERCQSELYFHAGVKRPRK